MVHVQQCVRSTNHWVLKELGVSLLRIPESSQDHTGGGDTSSGFQPMILFVCVCEENQAHSCDPNKYMLHRIYCCCCCLLGGKTNRGNVTQAAEWCVTVAHAQNTNMVIRVQINEQRESAQI